MPLSVGTVDAPMSQDPATAQRVAMPTTPPPNVNTKRDLA
jgi:hypothetical protein